MSISLYALSDRLEDAVPARRGVPADYDQLIMDAVAQLGTDAPLIRTATLAVVSGTATYNLPADFQSLIELAGPARASGVILASEGIIPLSSSWEESYEIGGGQITFYPTPAYTATRTYRYAAGYALVDEAYPRLTEAGARLALLYGQYLVLMAQAGPAAGNAWKYQIGDEAVDKTGQGKGLAAQANEMLQAYQRSVRRGQGYGQVARYGIEGADSI